MKHLFILIAALMLCGCGEKSVAEYRRKEEAKAAQEAKVQADIAELNRRFDALERRVMEMPPDHGQKMAWEIVQMYDVLRRQFEMTEYIYTNLQRVEVTKKQQSITINGVEIDVAKVLEDTLKKMTQGPRQ